MWLGTGRIDDVRALLTGVIGIGKRRGAGVGMIEPGSLVVEPVDADPATWGLVTGPHDFDFATPRVGGRVDTVVFDEADALPDVARSVADERIGLDGVAHIAAMACAQASEACRELVRLCARETALGRPRLLAHCAGRDAIVEQVHALRAAIETAAADEDAAEEVALLAARLRAFLECADGGAVATVAIAPGETPALAVVHHAPVRLLRHVFDTTRAAFLVSATLAVPAARANPNDLLRALPRRRRESQHRNAARRMGRSTHPHPEREHQRCNRLVHRGTRHRDRAVRGRTRERSAQHRVQTDRQAT